MSAIGLPMEALFPPDSKPLGRKGKKGKPVAEYSYFDANGVLIYQVVRMEPKSFPQRRPIGNGKWAWNLAGVQRVLYRLPELLAAPDNAWILVVEGEKDADNLAKLGFVVTTAPQGAGKWDKVDDSPLHGRKVCVIPDLDAPGREHAQDIVRSLHGKAAAIRVLELPVAELQASSPAATKLKDASDWLAAGGTAEQLAALIEGASDATPVAKAAATPKTPPAANREVQLTDLGNAELFVRQHGSDLRYVRYAGGDAGDWFVWTGQRWALDTSGEVWERAKSVAEGMLQAAIGQGCPSDETKWALKSQAVERIRAMLTLVRSSKPIPATPADFDRDPWLLGVQNGIVDLKTGELRPHAREHYITKLAATVYDAAAEAPTWTRILPEIFSGDEDLIAFVQRLLGMALTGDVREHVLAIFYGSGRNGKNTLLDCVAGIMGDYTTPAPPGLLVTHGRDEHPTEIAGLAGMRLIIASETDEAKRLRVAHVKMLTGDEYLTGRKMRQDFFKFRRTFKTILMTNNKPAVREQSAAIWERVMLVPFNVSFRGREDKEIPDKLRTEWPGIFRWLLAGCLEWQRHGLQPPRAVRVATEGYRDEQDALVPFLEACCVQDEDARVSRSAIWDAYSHWGQAHNERLLDRVSFYERLRTKGFTDDKFREGGVIVRGFVGVGLLASAGPAGQTQPMHTQLELGDIDDIAASYNPD